MVTWSQPLMVGPECSSNSDDDGNNNRQTFNNLYYATVDCVNTNDGQPTNSYPFSDTTPFIQRIFFCQLHLLLHNYMH